MKSLVKDYLEKIYEISTQSDTREESFYPALKSFLESYCKSNDKSHIRVVTMPKNTGGGNPDFRLWDGEQHIVGYIEAKEPTKKLDFIEKSEQLKKYRQVFPNLILTNFIEFRLYRNGELLEKAIITNPIVFHELNRRPTVQNFELFCGLLEKFFSFSKTRVYDSKTLAKELAKRTKFLKDVIEMELKA